MKYSDDIIKDFNKKEALAMEATRDGFGRGLVVAGEKNSSVVAICADLAESTRSHWFKEKFPERYVEVGVAEQNLACVGAGMAAVGKKPFIMSYAAFSPGRNNEQIRTTISLNEQPVVVVGAHAGITVGPDGATHQALEDIGLMRMQPNMNVLVPCDSAQSKAMTEFLSEFDEPAYLRLGRSKYPVITKAEAGFEPGKAYVYRESTDMDVVVFACGSLVYEALMAAEDLAELDIEVGVVNVATIKPLDSETILSMVEKSGAVVTAEEHQVHGGLGSAISELLVKHHPVPIEMVGVQDQFGQSGTPDELMIHYGLIKEGIVTAVKKVLKRK